MQKASVRICILFINLPHWSLTYTKPYDMISISSKVSDQKWTFNLGN